MKNAIDVVHCHHRTCGVYMRILSSIAKVPFVWSNHLDDIPYDFLHRKTTFYGKKVICVSSALRRFCVNKLRIPEKDTEVVIHGINPEAYCYESEYVSRFRSEHNITDEIVIGLFARMAPIKGHMCLIEALAKLPAEKLKKTKTVFFGGTDGEYVNELKREIRQRKLDDYICIEGFVTPSKALSLSDMTVLPSLNEGFGIVSIESFLMKKPHIRTKTAGYEDIKDGCIGFEVGDSSALSTELERYIDGIDYSAMIEKAYQLFTEKCTLERMAERIYGIYQECIGNK